jgi:hypothetical protein
MAYQQRELNLLLRALQPNSLAQRTQWCVCVCFGVCECVCECIEYLLYMSIMRYNFIRLCLKIHTHTHTRTHTHTHTHTHKYTHTHTHTHTRAQVRGYFRLSAAPPAALEEDPPQHDLPPQERVRPSLSVYCLLPAACYMLYAAYCRLYAVCCLHLAHHAPLSFAESTPLTALRSAGQSSYSTRNSTIIPDWNSMAQQ